MGKSSKVILAAIALVILSAGSFIIYNLKNKKVDASVNLSSGQYCKNGGMYCISAVVKYKNGELMRGALVRIQFADGSVWGTNYVTDSEGKFGAFYSLDKGSKVKFIINSAGANSRQAIISKSLAKGVNNIILLTNFNSGSSNPTTPTPTVTATRTTSPITLPEPITKTPTRTPIPLPSPSTTVSRTVSSTPTGGDLSF